MEARVQAALLLAAALAALPLLRRPSEVEPCAAPAELAARDGHTLHAGCGGGAPVRGPARLLLGQGIDPNTADAATLEVLPGIGPSRAEAIVATRCERRFAGPGDLARVPGIGPRLRAGVEPWLEIDPDAEPVCGATPSASSTSRRP